MKTIFAFLVLVALSANSVCVGQGGTTVVHPLQGGAQPQYGYVAPPQNYVPPQSYVPPQNVPLQPYAPPQQNCYLGLNVEPLTSVSGAGQVSRILSVVPGSPAQRAGLEAGDQIIAVNGRRFPNAALGAGEVASYIQSAITPYRTVNHRVRPAGPVAKNVSLLVINVRNGQQVNINVSVTCQ